MIIAIGDIHGEFDKFYFELEKFFDGREAEQGVNFVQVGDFGIGFNPLREWKELLPIRKILKINNSKLSVIRGNHDNPAYWDSLIGFQSDGLIEFVPDNTIRKIDDKICYFAGGAISIDRTRRRQGLDYWRGEEYNIDRKTFNLAGEHIDILFTHDVYHGCSPFTVNNHIVNYFKEIDDNLEGDLLLHNSRMETLYSEIIKTNPNFAWYHGHYHESHLTVNGEQKTHSLNIFEFKEVR